MAYDPRFPDRPQTPEFDKLSELAIHQDGLGPGDFLTEDELNALIYIAKNRTAFAVLSLGKEAANMSIYMDAFILGLQYGREKR